MKSNANDNTPSADPVAEAATAYLEHRNLLTRCAGSRPLLVARCAKYLRDKFGLQAVRARGIAQRAADVIVASRQRIYFELEPGGDRVAVCDPDRGTRRTITVTQALRMVALSGAASASA